ncbi:hypothetical protein HZS55_18450 [Halosimplex rubrum]|uniref:SipW-cognate class signal peptide n=1 Tax=Halosimplex rubrum TaxID=869889 RepID=A0A7D5T663_9EURY|nr:TasA family protein [Halosimplex rubrum]QLH79150.1 hypothetical protein HZS55_18450 [Halosimplex rubrum]
MTDEDNSKTIELNRRRVLGGIITVGGAAAAAGAGTTAFFSDSESSEDNTVTAGTLDLTVNDGDSFSYSVGDIAPGDPFEVTVNLSKSGIDADRIVVGTSTDQGEAEVNLADRLVVDAVSWSGTIESGGTPDSVQSMADTDIVLDASTINNGSTGELTVSGTFDQNAGNDYQGASVDIDHTFTLYQDSTQVNG